MVSRTTRKLIRLATEAMTALDDTPMSKEEIEYQKKKVKALKFLMRSGRELEKIRKSRWRF